MPVSHHGKFIRVQNTYIRISHIITIKPKELVHYDQDDRILGKDFPEIHIETSKESLAFLFKDFEERDKALVDVLEVLRGE
ncbi:hypothetical protein [Pedobacter frigidisoli]|uniref:hypothetical protein n=1 Tax=Pedobacter frigidisoli TaxID=2530455 RepID=UPI00292D622D|nr:hypothetical protein [Pedobacter frigidisoli]